MAVRFLVLFLTMINESLGKQMGLLVEHIVTLILNILFPLKTCKAFLHINLHLQCLTHIILILSNQHKSYKKITS